MKALIKKELRLSGRLLCIWMAIMLVLCIFCWFESLSLKSSFSEMSKMFEQFPRLLTIMFGIKADLSTAIGWYSCLYFWTEILVVAYGVSLGLSCIAREKQQGTAEYLFTKPINRKKIVLSKVAASVINLAVFSVFTGLCSYFLLVLPMGGLEQEGAVITTTAGLFLTQVMFFALGLLLSSLFASYKAAVRVSTIAVLVFYAIAFAAEYTGAHFLDYLTPLRYYDVYEVALHGFHAPCLIATIFLVGSCIAITLNGWERREL